MSDSSDEIILYSGRKHGKKKSTNSSTSGAHQFADENSESGIELNHRKPFTPFQGTDSSGSIGVQEYAPPPCTSVARNPIPLRNKFAEHFLLATPPRSDIQLPEQQRRQRMRTNSQIETLSDYIPNSKTNQNHLILTNDKSSVVINDSGEKLAEDYSHHNVTEFCQKTPSLGYSQIQDVHQLETNQYDPIWDSLNCKSSISFHRNLQRCRTKSDITSFVAGEGHNCNKARFMSDEALETYGAQIEIGTCEAACAKLDELSLHTDESDSGSIERRYKTTDPEHKIDDLKGEKDIMPRSHATLADRRSVGLSLEEEELSLSQSGEFLPDSKDYEQVNRQGSRCEKASIYLPDSAYSSFLRRKKNLAFANAIVGNDDRDRHDDFDIMDRERESLRRTAKSICIASAQEQNDGDVQESLRRAWENDRDRKKSRKQERERLRQLGLLTKNRKIDSHPKHTESSSKEKLRTELRVFLKSSATSLSLPPMDPKERKFIHDIANSLGLKSKSMGSGKARFPILIKPTRRSQHDSNGFVAIDYHLSLKRSISRKSKGVKRPSPAIRTHQKRGFNGAVSYQDGEIVGAAAPELGQDNKGRAMLERMGWSTGTALGACNNKGSVQPVTHTVKTTKAGLG